MKRHFFTLLCALFIAWLATNIRANPNQNATLWIQSSSEYQALTRSIYASAISQLPKALADTTWSAALEQTPGYESLSPAVILDIDETVLDNSPYQASLINADFTFESSTWDSWIAMASAKSVPGALEFVKTADGLGIKIYYVTNRACTQREAVTDTCPQLADTIRNLTALGFPAVPENHFLLKNKTPDWGSEKASRREEIAEANRILMIIGDDLGDFIPDVKLPRASRNDPQLVADMLNKRDQLTASHADRWGKQWFLLPNPSYGSWFSTIKAQPAAHLEPDPVITALMVQAKEDAALNVSTGVLPCEGNTTSLHTIQGEGEKSPLEGQVVTTTGVVTALNAAGYFISELSPDDNPATSEGLYIYDRSHTPAIGDYLSIIGKVTEHATPASRPRSYETELSAVSCVKKLGTRPVPTVVIAWPPDAGVSLEQYEGMTITVPGPLFVTDTSKLGRYGDILVSQNNRLYAATHHHPIGDGAEEADQLNAQNQIAIDDGLPGTYPNETRFPQGGLAGENTLRLGYSAPSITGVLRENYGDYRLVPEPGFHFAPTNLRPVAPTRQQQQDLRIAAFNVRNYFHGEQDVDLRGTRGAQTVVDLKRQTAKLVAAIQELDADILGLVEIENEGLDQETGPLSQLLDAVNAGLPTDKHYVGYDVGVDRLGNDEIAVAFAYRLSRVSVQKLDGTRFGPAELPEHQTRPSVAGLFQDSASGESILAIVNHFKSKRPSCGSDEHPLSGGCNQVRTEMAQRLNTWLATIAANHQVDNILILGDLNAHKHESPITVLQHAGFTDLLDNPAVVLSGDYTHVYQGESARLDYLLGSEALVAKVRQALIWHINADEPDVLDYQSRFYEPGRDFADQTPKPSHLFDAGPYRSSDHDPIIVDFNFATADVTEPVVLKPDDVPPKPPASLRGVALRQWLKDHWYDDHHSDLGYSVARVEMYSYIDVAGDGQVHGVYSGFSQPAKETTFLNPINAEHTVPQSWFDKKSPMRSDIHILFPTHKDVNSARGSLPFGDIEDDQTDKWYGVDSQSGELQILRNALPSLSTRDNYGEYENNSTFEPPEQQKGDTARAIFYFYTMYPSQAGGIERIIKTGELESLYQWHLNDPVVEPSQDPATSREWQRNLRIAEKQGNYNPYVVYPELICRAWEIRDCD